MSRWPIPTGPFRPLSRSERINKLIEQALSRIDTGDTSLDGLTVGLSVKIPDEVLGMPDSDSDLARAVLRQIALACTMAADDATGAVR